jgi:shikimate kinase
MASKRDVKKSINNLTFELVSECFSYKYFHPKKKHDKTDAALENLVKTRNELIQKVNHPVDTKDHKKNRSYFREIIKDMNKMVSLMDDIG